MKEPPINWRLGHISYAATVSQRLIFTKFESIYKVSWCKHKDMEHSNFAIAHNLAMNRFARGITSRLYIRSIYLRNTTNFVVPENYKPNRSLLKQLPWKAGLDIWWKSLSPNRLSDLQKELVEFMLPSHLQENQRIIKEFKKTTIDDKGNYINEVGFKIINNEEKPTKHLVFIHGYGASLGCFARNFQIINKFKDNEYNYHVHFLDTLTFVLSSNPKVNNGTIN